MFASNGGEIGASFLRRTSEAFHWRGRHIFVSLYGNMAQRAGVISLALRKPWTRMCARTRVNG